MKLYHDENQNKFPLRISIRGSTGTPPQSAATATNWWDFTQALGGKDGTAVGKIIPPAINRPLYPYVKEFEVFHCRADQGQEYKYKSIDLPERPSLWEICGCSYTYNAVAPVKSAAEIGTTGVANKSDTTFANPSKLVLLYERPAADFGIEGTVVLWHRAKNADALLLTEHYARGEKLVAPFLFLDGHVETLIFRNGEFPWDSPRIAWH
jgi:prepilin-type processing-associated H-X9-DG protein